MPPLTPLVKPLVNGEKLVECKDCKYATTCPVVVAVFVQSGNDSQLNEDEQ